DGVTQHEMADLDEAVEIGLEIKIHVAELAQRIVGSKAAQGDDAASDLARRGDGIEDVGRLARGADRHHHVAARAVELDLLGKYVLEAVVVAEAGEDAAVVARHGADAGVLAQIRRHVAGDGGAAAVADEDQLVAAVVTAPRVPGAPAQHLVHAELLAAAVARLNAPQNARENVGIAVEP